MANPRLILGLQSEHYIFLYWQKFVSMTVLLLVLLR
jgi:hypothetical protein